LASSIGVRGSAFERASGFFLVLGILGTGGVERVSWLSDSLVVEERWRVDGMPLFGFGEKSRNF